MRSPIVTLLIFVCFNAQANVLQYFTGISYSNPAELFTIKKNEFIIGGTGFHTEGRFQGTVLNFNTFQPDYGISRSSTNSFLPYGRIGVRINDKWVFAVDVTEPFHSNLNWGNHSVTRFAATQTYLTDVELSPRISYSFNPKLFLGAGLNFNFMKNNEANWALPNGMLTSANLINRTSSFGLGFNLGVYYLFNPTNFLGVAYYSTIRQNSFGVSTFENRINNEHGFDFNMPATTLVSYVHLFSKTWLANIKFILSEWDVNQKVRFTNTSAPPPLNPDFTFYMGFRKSAAVLGALRHQYNEKFGITGIAMVDHGPERDAFRPLNFPSDTQYFLAVVGDYRLNKTTTIELLYGYGWENTMLQNHVNMNGQAIPFTTGKVNLNANILDLKIKVQM